jgi:hypothetical protein
LRRVKTVQRKIAILYTKKRFYTEGSLFMHPLRNFEEYEISFEKAILRPKITGVGIVFSSKSKGVAEWDKEEL